MRHPEDQVSLARLMRVGQLAGFTVHAEATWRTLSHDLVHVYTEGSINLGADASSVHIACQLITGRLREISNGLVMGLSPPVVRPLYPPLDPPPTEPQDERPIEL